MSTEPATYPGHRFSAAVINHVAWLYHRFSFSLRDIELILGKRGMVVSDESNRRWYLRFGTEFVVKLRKRRPKPGDTWHMDNGFCCELVAPPRAVTKHGMARRPRVAFVRPDQSFKGR